MTSPATELSVGAEETRRKMVCLGNGTGAVTLVSLEMSADALGVAVEEV